MKLTQVKESFEGSNLQGIVQESQGFERSKPQDRGSIFYLRVPLPNVATIMECLVNDCRTLNGDIS